MKILVASGGILGYTNCVRASGTAVLDEVVIFGQDERLQRTPVCV